MVLTGFGRLSLVERIAKRLPDPPPVLELDVTDPGQLDVAGRAGVRAHRRARRRGARHRVRAAGGARRQLPEHAVGGRSHRRARVGLLAQGAGHGRAAADGPAAEPIVGLDFDASRGLAGLRLDGRGQGRRSSRRARYLARDLGPRGIRVNLMSAGPLRTMAARASPASTSFEGLWPSGPRWAGT